MDKIMLVGPVGVGKSTLTQKLRGDEIAYKKTQAVEFSDNIIDTPGEYLQHRQFYNTLVTISSDAKLACFILSANGSEQVYPPNFIQQFRCPGIGIINKIDELSNSQEDQERLQASKQQLLNAGVTKVFTVSLKDGTGFNELESFLLNYKE